MPTYPPTPTVDQVDDYHGTPVADPYRWLEDTGAPETKAWISAQNALTFGCLAEIQARERLRARLTELWDFPRAMAPVRRGHRLFQLRNSGLQNQDVLVVLDKRGDIAILRTLGASGSDIAWVFLLQGALIGVVGVVAGSAVGALGSLLVPALVGWLEHLLGFQFLNTDVYPVSFVPVDLLPRDIGLVGAVAFAMCVLAAIYPARRAARLAPARVLSQDR